MSSNKKTVEQRQAEAELAEIENHCVQIERQLAGLQVTVEKLRRRAKTKTKQARQSAGPAAMREVIDLLRQGPCTQKQIIVETGLNQGTVSHALAALLDDELVEETGEKVDGSRELKLVRGRSADVRRMYAEAVSLVRGSSRERVR